MNSSAQPTKVLVLGASGFIGKAALKHISSLDGIVAVAAMRSSANVPGAAAVARCDILDEASLLAAFAGVDCVVNCYREGSSEEESAVAISNVLSACAKAGVKKLVYLSSVAVYGDRTGDIHELSAPIEPINWYGRAKAHAERMCKERASDALRIAVLRPSLVYGPGGEEWSANFIRSVHDGELVRSAGDATGYANLIYVNDLARMCASLVSADLPVFCLYNANGSGRVTFGQYFSAVHRALGDSRPPQGWNALLRRSASKLRRPGRAVLKIVGIAGKPILRRSRGARETLRKIEHELRARPEDAPRGAYSRTAYFVTEHAERAGLKAGTPLQEGVAASVAWARAQSII